VLDKAMKAVLGVKMMSRWGYETANRDRVAEAEQLLLSHHYARPVVRELGSSATPASREPATSWPGRLVIASAVAAGISGERGIVAVADF
jgi:hypothetical protein